MWQKKILAWFLWLVAIGLFALIWYAVPTTAVWQAWRQLGGWQVGMLIVLNGAVLVLLTSRWWLLLWGLGYRLPLGKLIAHRLAAFGMSYLTPGPQFGGEPMQVLLVEKVHGVPRTTAVSAVSLDKTLELLVNFTFLAVGVLALLHSGLFGDSIGWQLGLLTAVLCACPLFYLAAVWLGWQPLTIIIQKVMPLLSWRPAWGKAVDEGRRIMANSEKQAGQFCRRAPHLLLMALLVSLLGWVVMVVEYALMLAFLGAVLSPMQIVIMLTAVRVAFLLPLPGGLGTLEASQVWLLQMMGGEAAVGVSASLLIRARDILLSVSGIWWGSHMLPKFVDRQQ